MFIATADPMPLYAIDEIGDLLTEIHLRSDRGVDCLATAEAAAHRLAPAERDLLGRVLDDLVAVAERHAEAAEAA